MKTPSLDFNALHAFYQGGGTPRDMARLLHQRHDALADPGVYIHAATPEALEMQIACLPAFDPARFPLWGIPFAVKDNIDVSGLPTTAACPAFAYEPTEDAVVVARLKAAGAIVTGKVNLDQFATGLVGVRSPYPPPRNAFDASIVPGGSSAGSAIAVAQGLASFALGTDTAGSGRVPAGLNNLVGLKPSLGALSARGMVPACRTLDTVSVFALSVADARAVFDVACAFDPLDAYSRPLAMAAPAPLRRLGVPRPQDRLFFGDSLMEAAFEAALVRLRAQGAELVDIDMTPFFAVARLLYDGPWVAERRAAIRAFMDARPEALHPVTRAIIAKADGQSAADTFEAFYALAALRRQSEPVWHDIDALVVPTAPFAPTLDDLIADPITPNARLGTYTNFVNLLDLSALALPGPFRADGFPAGITLIAPRGFDHRLAAFGAVFFPGTGGRNANTHEAP
jgi:allophanate hydrolase